MAELVTLVSRSQFDGPQVRRDARHGCTDVISAPELRNCVWWLLRFFRQT